MDKQAKQNAFMGSSTNKTSNYKNKTSLGKRKKSSDGSDILDSAILSETSKKIQKVTHSNMKEDRESVEKMKSEVKFELSFVQIKMACPSGYGHTITLSDDGIVHSFGRNIEGELGLGHHNKVSLPTPIPNLPQISVIACGQFFTVCVDDEGFIWSFGKNDYGQLGTGNKTKFNVPQKILNIPPVLSVECGFAHTLIITNDSDLWSCGSNGYGQLCHGDKENRLIPQKTSFSNISKISTGWNYSFFQYNKGEIFACGFNQYGQCGLGHFDSPQITPILIPNVPSNIVHFVCGSHQSLFLDSNGNAFFAGKMQHELNKIPNIPPIKIISCACSSCYLIDFEGNLWTFGYNRFGQLGHRDQTELIAPKIVNTLKDIQQISYGSSGDHFFAKNSQLQIFATGRNTFGQLGTGDNQSVSTSKEINSQYSTIWRDEFYSRAKSARK